MHTGMVMTVRDLLDLPLLAGARAVAGDGAAADREVAWVAVIEGPVENFVRPAEVVLTTGIGCDESHFSQLAHDVLDSEAAALCAAFRPGGELTTAVTTTQTTTGHRQHRAKPGRSADRGLESGVACSWGSSGLPPWSSTTCTYITPLTQRSAPCSCWLGACRVEVTMLAQLDLVATMRARAVLSPGRSEGRSL